jgi:hypothetical protein
MRQKLTIAVCLALCVPAAFTACNQSTNANTQSADSTAAATKFNGYESQIKWGEHLVTIGGCNDCHTPKKMGPHGPENDSSLTLSGHPAQMPAPDIDRKMAESKGLAVTNTLTAWVGPWGVSFAANLTSDSTGIGNWKEEQFIKCVREGKWMGLDNTRPLLPPMPWEDIRQMTDDELKAVFAYLKSTKPIHNVQPAAMPPVTAMKH